MSEHIKNCEHSVQPAVYSGLTRAAVQTHKVPAKDRLIRCPMPGDASERIGLAFGQGKGRGNTGH